MHVDWRMMVGSRNLSLPRNQKSMKSGKCRRRANFIPKKIFSDGFDGISVGTSSVS